MPAISSCGGVRFAAKCRYLTARCPSGCESWLHPRAVTAHVELSRCRGVPWVDNVEDSALVPEPAVTLFTERLPARLVGPVAVSQDRLSFGLTERVPLDVLHGVVVRSAVEGVSARRWVYVVRAAVERHVPQAIERALTAGGFDEIE